MASLSETRASELRATLAKAAAPWRMLPISREVLERAGRPFPEEPIRSLDAIHLATAVIVADAMADVALLSLDRRVRTAGARLGLRVVPE